MFEQIKTPAYVIDEAQLRKNLEIIKEVIDATGCKVLLAQKAFSALDTYELLSEYLHGTTASSLHEAMLGQQMKGENHIFSPAFKEEELEQIVQICDHVVFNSVQQIKRFQEKCLNIAKNKGKSIGIGIRINPQISTQTEHPMYDPCAPGSRFGITSTDLNAELKKDTHFLDAIEGLHFHTLCEQNSDDLEKTLLAVEEKFGDILHLPQIKWLNMGGGHHISRADYDVARLIRLILHMQQTYQVQVYLEPGEAIALNAGYLVTKVLEKGKNEIEILILDTSASCHMPDVLEMPYRPPLKGSGHPKEKPFTYRLSSATCLSGDVIGDYSFDREMQVGDILVFEDMAIYSMVKNNTFNGINLPDIVIRREDGSMEIVKSFGYPDFVSRLGRGINVPKYRMPGEFESHHGCILSWPTREGSWRKKGRYAKEIMAKMARKIAESERVYLTCRPAYVKELQQMFAMEENIRIMGIPSDDAWTRDIGPSFVYTRNQDLIGVDWKFNAWGGEVDGLYEDYVLDDAFARAFCREMQVPTLDAHPFVFEGGAVHVDGEGTGIVTKACLLSAGRNPHLSMEEIEEQLKKYLGLEKIIWLEHGIYMDETNEHIDNMLAFIRPGEVVLAWCEEEGDVQTMYSQEALDVLSKEVDAKGRKFVVHKLPIPKERVVVREEEVEGFVYSKKEEQRFVGERLAASYVNFYIANQAVLLPQFGDENDALAVRILSDLFPNREIVPIASRELLLGGGNIHCLTQQIPRLKHEEDLTW